MVNEAAFLRALEMFGPAEAAALSACAKSVAGEVYEIRIYTGKAVALVTDAGVRFCRAGGGTASFPAQDRLRFSAAQTYAVVSGAADQAPFLHERELKHGYLTKNGCRVGVCGFSPEGKLTGGAVSSVNIRIPFGGDFGPADPLLKRLLERTGGLLAAGPPGCGKTTFLKKCVTLLAGEALGWRRTAVIDERDEFSCASLASEGVITADVIRGTDKARGIQTALRLFSPEYIVCDEIGGAAETAGMLEGLNSGVRFIASIHAADRAQLKRRPQFRALWQAGVFEDIIFLSALCKGTFTDRVTAGEPL